MISIFSIFQDFLPETQSAEYNIMNFNISLEDELKYETIDIHQNNLQKCDTSVPNDSTNAIFDSSQR